MQEGFYRYEYMSDFEKFKEEFPSKEKFDNCLTSKRITGKKYEHVLNVWNKFEMKTMKDYHDFHLRYVLFLAEVFRKTINNSFENHALCPSHYLITPGLRCNTSKEKN